MTTVNVSIPETLKDFVDTQVQDRGYSTSTEYVRDLILKDQVNQAEQRLASLMLEGLESGPNIPVNDVYWNSKREALKQRYPAQ